MYTNLISQIAFGTKPGWKMVYLSAPMLIENIIHIHKKQHHQADQKHTILIDDKAIIDLIGPKIIKKKFIIDFYFRCL